MAEKSKVREMHDVKHICHCKHSTFGKALLGVGLFVVGLLYLLSDYNLIIMSHINIWHLLLIVFGIALIGKAVK